MQRSIKNKFFRCALKIVLPLTFSLLFFSCEKPKPVQSTPETSTMTDRDGNVYKTVKIGNQWWMAENLKVKTFLNGDSILLEPSSNNWQSAGAAYCINGASPYGFLYNAHAVNDVRKIAPAGWHIPTDEEWKTLEMNLGMSRASVDSIGWRGNTEGDKLKIEQSSLENSTLYWEVNVEKQFIIWPNNESGFSAVPAGCRVFNGSFGIGPKLTGFWWSSSVYNNQNWFRYLDYSKSKVFRFYSDIQSGYSIRCVKD